MTQAPIHPRHKDEAAKAAGYEQPELVIRSIENGHWPGANETAVSILAHAQTLANLEAARAGLAEIDALLTNAPDSPSVIADAKAIAAPYRASDPVAEAVREAIAHHTDRSAALGGEHG